MVFGTLVFWNLCRILATTKLRVFGLFQRTAIRFSARCCLVIYFHDSQSALNNLDTIFGVCSLVMSAALFGTVGNNSS